MADNKLKFKTDPNLVKLFFAANLCVDTVMTANFVISGNLLVHKMASNMLKLNIDPNLVGFTFVTSLYLDFVSDSIRD